MIDFFDAHSHIQEKEFDQDRGEVLGRMRKAKVATIAVGTYLESSRRAAALAEAEPDVWATVGLHPTDTSEEFRPKEYEELAKNKKVVAIGECGLDYFWEEDKDLRRKQKEKFSAQIKLALSLDKPLMIHSRPSRGSMDAYEDVLEILTHNLRPKTYPSGNVHFFVGDQNISRRFLDLGFTMSFTGVITFARDYDEVVNYLPIDSILAETDCPYVAPVPYRGKRNEPAYVTEVVKKIAEIKKLPPESAAEALYENTRRVFGI